MLFFRRRDTSNQSQLTDQERCIHACLFFAFILLCLTIILFYFAITSKDVNEPRLYYYLGAGFSFSFLILIVLCTITSIRRFYRTPVSSASRRVITPDSEHSSSKRQSSEP